MLWLWQSSVQTAESIVLYRLLLGRYILLKVNIKIFKTVILPVVLCGVKIGRSHLAKNVRSGCLKIGC
jgi:hypothetical protein